MPMPSGPNHGKPWIDILQELSEADLLKSGRIIFAKKSEKLFDNFVTIYV